MIKIGEGETAEVFNIESGKVVKLFKRDFCDDSAIHMEFETAKLMGDSTDFAPKVFDVIHLNGRKGYVMEEVQGTLFQDQIDRKADKLEYHARLLGEAHRQLHNKKDIEELTNLPNIKKNSEKFLGSVKKNFPDTVVMWLFGLFSSLPEETSLLHGDFMPYNIIISNGRLQILDWAEPAFGPPMMDVARTLNFILDPTDYPSSLYTKRAQVFMKHYMEAYLQQEPLNTNVLHTCLLLNAVYEYNWAVYSQQSDAYTRRTKEFILNNFDEYGSDTLINLEMFSISE